jgi:hypothetical protein
MRERFMGPTAGVRSAERDWDRYAPDPSSNILLEPDIPDVGPGQRNERGVGLDVHEILKREAFLSPEASCDDHFEKNRPCPTGIHGVSDQYVILDSFHKVQDSRIEQGEYKWNFMVQGVTGDQVIGVRDRVDTVIMIQMGAFTFPIPQEVPYVLNNAPGVTPSGTNQLVLIQNNTSAPGDAPTLVPNTPGSFPGFGQYPPQILTPPNTYIVPWVNNPYTQVPFGNRLTVQFKEAGLQSYSDANGARHHWEFTVSYISIAGVNPTLLQAIPLAGIWDTFVFTDPLQDVHGMTLVFRGADLPIVFQPDVFYDVPVISDGAASPGPYLQFQAQNHGLNAGDRVFVVGFKSGVAVLDAYVNRPEGHAVNGSPDAPLNPSVPLASPPHLFTNVFWTDPAISIIDFLPAPVLPQYVTVRVAKRRLRIPIRLRRVVGRLTQYLGA